MEAPIGLRLATAVSPRGALITHGLIPRPEVGHVLYIFIKRTWERIGGQDWPRLRWRGSPLLVFTGSSVRQGGCPSCAKGGRKVPLRREQAMNQLAPECAPPVHSIAAARFVR